MLMCLMALVFGLSVSAEAKKEKQKDVTVEYRVDPPMHCANCEKKIKENIRFVKGVKKIETSVPAQRVTVVYDPAKCTPESLEAAFAKIGYTVTPLPEKSNLQGQQETDKH